MTGELGFEILLILVIVVLILRTSSLFAETDDPAVRTMRRVLSSGAFCLATAALFGFGFTIGEQVAAPAGVAATENVGVFGVASLACLGVPLLRIVKERVPLAVLRFAPLLFLLAGLTTGVAATTVLGRNAQVSLR